MKSQPQKTPIAKAILRKKGNATSGQDEGVGRYLLPPHTTKRMATTNLKTKHNQNCQKMEWLYGSPTTKELKKKHLSRPVGEEEMGRQGGEDSQQGGDWQTR